MPNLTRSQQSTTSFFYLTIVLWEQVHFSYLEHKQNGFYQNYSGLLTRGKSGWEKAVCKAQKYRKSRAGQETAVGKQKDTTGHTI